ncbi:hypothetical protein LTR81_018800 [Elasticomyces elasticus]
MGTYNMGQGKHNPGPQDSHVTTNDTAWNITPPDDDDEGYLDSKQEAKKVQVWLKKTEARAAKHNDRPSFIQYLYKVSKYKPQHWEYQAWIYAHPEDIEAVEALLQPGDRDLEPESASTDFEALGERMGGRKVEEMQRQCFGGWNFESAGAGPGLTDIVGPFMMDETLEVSEQQQDLPGSSVTMATNANFDQGARGTTQTNPIVIDDDDEQEPRLKRLKLRHGSVEAAGSGKVEGSPMGLEM